ncbi:MAG TPA: hypothetical protein VF112_09350, partial [Candidatus Dormibacteraeota bacterium]
FQRLTRDLEAEMAAEPWGWQPDRVLPEEVVPLLVAARPELAERWRPDDETASQPYLAMISLVAELVAAVTASQTEHLDGLFHVAERLLEEGSREVRELVAVGLLEGLQDRSLKASVPLDAWEGWLGPRSRTVWTILAPLWGDEAGAEEVRLRIEEVLGRLERGSVTPAVP